MNKKKAFTLIELLVVISIIALLLSILMPALGRAREQAREIVCRSNLKSIGQIAMLYAVDHKDKLFPDWFSYPYYMNVLEQKQQDALANSMWQYCTENYWNDPKILFCPSATKIAGIDGVTPDIRETGPDDQRHWGHTFWAWRTPWARPLKVTGKVCASSYGVNDLAGTPYRQSAVEQANANKVFWGSIRQTGAANIPLSFDCAWYSIMPHASDTNPSPLAYDKSHTDQSGGALDPALLPRHRDGINIITMDLSAKRTSLKSLWTYKWHRQFDINNRWTKGNARWPEWMQKLKE